jgi:signal peptidase I
LTPARFRGPWRVAVVEGSMRPAIEPGDWLLVDPVVTRWPRRGSIVVIREPETDVLAIKRVAARPNEEVRGIVVRDPETAQDVTVSVRLGPDEAWLLGDNLEASIDSRRYGPVPLDLLVARAWFRYAPLRRIGRLPRP